MLRGGAGILANCWADDNQSSQMSGINAAMGCVAFKQMGNHNDAS